MKNMDKMGIAKWVRPVLSITMVVVGVLLFLTFLYPMMPGTTEKLLWMEVLSYSLLIIGGVIIFFLKKKGTYIIVGVACFFLGLYDIISELVIMFDMASLKNIFYLIFSAIIAIVPLMDFFMIIFSIRYIQGHKRNAIRISICAFVPLIVWILGFIVIVIMAWGLPLTAILFYTQVYLSRIALYVVFIIVLFSPGVREDFTEWRLYEMSEDMYKTMIIDPKSTIYRGDLIALGRMLKAPETWGDSEVVPGSKECHINFGRDMNLRRLIFRKLPDSEKIRVSVIAEGEKAYIQGARFDFNGMLPLDGDLETCQSVRFIGEKGFFIDISVRDDNAIPQERYLVDRVLHNIKSKIRRKKSA